MQTRFGSGSERYRYARPNDLDLIVQMLGDEEVGRWLWFVPASSATLRGFFLPLIEKQWQDLADATPPTTAVFIAEDADGTFIGQGAAIAVPGSAGGFEIGYQLPKTSWGHGIGTRMAEFLALWSIETHDAYRLQAGCLEGNAGSRRILENLGMAIEGTRPDFRLKGDTRHCELEYGMRVADIDPEILARADAWMETRARE